MNIENVKELLEEFSKNMDESSEEYYMQLETLKKQEGGGSISKDKKYIDTGLTPSYEDVFGTLYKGPSKKHGERNKPLSFSL